MEVAAGIWVLLVLTSNTEAGSCVSFLGIPLMLSQAGRGGTSTCYLRQGNKINSISASCTKAGSEVTLKQWGKKGLVSPTCCAAIRGCQEYLFLLTWGLLVWMPGEQESGKTKGIVLQEGNCADESLKGALPADSEPTWSRGWRRRPARARTVSDGADSIDPGATWGGASPSVDGWMLVSTE